tara:strand:- start:9574 stop:10098 length:525 start_codon:yes stop_codon:yes gene_type:complete
MKSKKDTEPIIVLGIDPGYDRFGVALVKKEDGRESLLFSDCFVTNKSDEFSDRLLFLGKELENLLKKWSPDAVAVENLFVTKNQKTASRVSEVRGMVIYLSKTFNLPIFEYTPLEIKMTIAGHGTAPKNQVAIMVGHTVKLPEKKRLDDEFDAIATGLACLYRDINTLSPKGIS